MTDPVVLGGVVVLVIGALGVQVVNAIVAWKTNTSVAKIETSVNSAATEARQLLAASEKRETALLGTIAKMEQAAALLAQAASHGVAAGALSPVPVEVVNTPLAVDQQPPGAKA